MSEILSGLQYLGEQLSPEMFNLFAVFIAGFLMIAVGAAVSAFQSTERLRQVAMVWSLIDDAVLNAILFLAVGENVDAVSLGEQYATEYAEAYGELIDSRMAYTIKHAELYIEQFAPFDFDFFAVYHRAENIYQNKVK